MAWGVCNVRHAYTHTQPFYCIVTQRSVLGVIKKNLTNTPRVCVACVSFPLHLPLVEDEAGVSSRQQGVGVPEVSHLSHTPR